MKRKWLLGILLVWIYISMILAILWLNNPDIFRKHDMDKLNTVREPRYIEHWVDLSPVNETCSYTGGVISGAPELYMETLTIDNINEDKLELNVKKGDTVKPEQVLLVHNDKKITLPYNALVVDITKKEKEGIGTLSIQLLNYDKLYISVAVDLDHIDRIHYDTPVRLLINDRECDSEILDIGYEVVGASVEVKLAVPAFVRPGTPAVAMFTTGTHTGMVMWKDFVFQDMSGRNYVKLKTATGYERVDVEVGETFTTEEDGVIWEHVEILSGISEGDILLCEMNDSNRKIEDLKESLLK